MEWVECKDIFNAVYTYVRASYISNWFSSKVKSRTVNESATEDENLVMSKTDEPQGETNVNSKETSATNTETVSESINREDESEVMDKIQLDIEEKFPFALASVCSNLATLDKEYRELKGYRGQPNFSEFMIEISEDFPLCERFVFPAIMYISSMVLIDIDEKRSDDFYDKYATSVSQIITELPYQQLNTTEKYPY